MSDAGRGRVRPAPSPHRRGVWTTAALFALGAALVVPPGGAVRGVPAGVPVGAPTDQTRAREWHLNVLRAPKAWKYSKGRGVTVAVLDTGVDKRHPDLIGQVVTGPDLTGGVRRAGTRYWGLHGTSMASIIAGHGHGLGQSQGMMGIAPQSRVLSVRVTLENDDPLRRDNGQQAGGDRDAVAQGIRYAVDHGADIVNMSLGGGRQSYNGTAAQESAIKYALGKGVILIASAGNDGSGANRKNFPAAYPGVISVGALDRGLRLWKDSNRRSRAAVCAPGVDIISADANGDYVVGTGTSASSAMVAGVAALVRSRYPRLSPAEVRQALIQGSPARPGYPTGSPTCRGTVDAVRTLLAANTINKTSSGPVETPLPYSAPAPTAESSEEGSGLLFPLLLVGGGLLVVLGVVLGWRQRRRPDEEQGDADAVPDYGLPSTPPMPREPFVAPGSPERPDAAPANVPLWESTEAPLPDIPPADPSPLDAPPADPVDGSWGAMSWDSGSYSWGTDEPSGPESALEQPPIELRPFVPGEFFPSGGNGHAVNGHNGDHVNGANGTALNGSAWDDDTASGPLTAPLPAVPPEQPDAPPGPDDGEPPVPPSDDPAEQADSAEPPGDESRGRHSRRSPSSDDEDHRPW